MGSLGKLYVTIGARTASFIKPLRRAQWYLQRFGTQADRVGRRMRRLGLFFSLALTTPIVAATTLSVKTFVKFEEAMRNVNTIAQQSERQFKATGHAVLKMAPLLGREPVGLAKALYNINSASFHAAAGLKVLRASAVAGTAGLATASEASKAIVAVLNAYGKSANQATDVSDIMFRTVEKGVLTFADLAEHLGAVVASAAAAGIEFAEVSAAAATMTRGGIGVAESFISLNRMIMRLIQGNKELNALFKRTAAGSAVAMLASQGLGAVMQVITKETKGQAKGLMYLGFKLRDLKAAQSLSRREGKDYAADLNAIAVRANRAGATMKAFKEQTKALSFQIKRLLSLVKVLRISFGKQLGVPLRIVINHFQHMVDAAIAMPPAFKRMVLGVLGLVAAIGPLLIGLGSFVLFLKVMSFGIAMLISPINILLVAISGMVAIIAVANLEFKSMANFLRKVNDSATAFAKTIKDRVGKHIGRLPASWKGITGVQARNYARTVSIVRETSKYHNKVKNAYQAWKGLLSVKTKMDMSSDIKDVKQYRDKLQDSIAIWKDFVAIRKGWSGVGEDPLSEGYIEIEDDLADMADIYKNKLIKLIKKAGYTTEELVKVTEEFNKITVQVGNHGKVTWDLIAAREQNAGKDAKKFGKDLADLVSSFANFGRKAGDSLLNLLKTWRLLSDESKKSVITSLKLMLAVFVLWKLGAIQAVLKVATTLTIILIPLLVKATAAMLTFAVATWQGQMALAALTTAIIAFKAGEFLAKSTNFSTFLLKYKVFSVTFGRMAANNFMDILHAANSFSGDLSRVLDEAFVRPGKGRKIEIDWSKYKSLLKLNEDEMWYEVDQFGKKIDAIEELDKAMGLDSFEKRIKTALNNALKLPGESLLAGFKKELERIPGLMKTLGVDGWKKLIEGFKGGGKDFTKLIDNIIGGLKPVVDLSGDIAPFAPKRGRPGGGGKSLAKQFHPISTGAGAALQKGTVEAFQAEQQSLRSVTILKQQKDLAVKQLKEEREQSERLATANQIAAAQYEKTATVMELAPA